MTTVPLVICNGNAHRYIIDISDVWLGRLWRAGETLVNVLRKAIVTRHQLHHAHGRTDKFCPPNTAMQFSGIHAPIFYPTCLEGWLFNKHVLHFLQAGAD